MQPTAVISYLWEKHLDALDGFLVDFPVDAVIVPPALLSERLRQIADERGCTIVTLDALRPAGYQREKRARKPLAALHGRLDGREWIPAELADGPDAVDRLRAIVRRRVDADVPPVVELLDTLSAVRATYDVRLFATSEDVMAEAKVAAAWAQRWKVPSLHLAHSLALIDPYTVHAELHTDVLAVYGPRGAEGYLDQGVDPARIVATGNPAWDGYASLREQRDPLRAELVARHSLRPDAPIIVFGTTWSARLTALDTGHAHPRSLEAFVSACAELERQGVAFTAVVKDRPSNDASGDETLARAVERAGLAGPLVRTSEDGSAWAVAADVLVAVDSNYLVEAMLAGTPAVNLTGTAMLPMPPPFDGASGVVDADAGDLARRLRELIEDPDVRDRLLARAARRVEHYHVGGADGQAAQRVAAQMVRLARTRPATRRSLLQRLRQRLRHARHVVVRQRGEQR